MRGALGACPAPGTPRRATPTRSTGQRWRRSRRCRLRRRLTQRALAARAGLSLSTIQAIEAGRAGRVRFGTMEKLADILDVEPEAIDDFAPPSDLAGTRPARAGA